MTAARMLAISWLVLVGGCGRMGFDRLAAHGGGGDPAANGDATPSADGGPTAANDAAPGADAAHGTDATSVVGGSDAASGSGSASPDAALPDAAAGSACLPPDPASATTFPAGSPCNGWGTETVVSATVQQTGGELLVSPNPSTFGAEGYCQRTGVLYGAAGSLLQLGNVIVGPGGVTGMQLGSGSTALELVDNGGMLTAQDASGTIAQAPYNATTMSWFWIHPNAANTGSVFATSPDGLTWTTFTTTNQAPAASNTVIIIAATLSGANSAPGTARFESFDLCPP